MSIAKIRQLNGSIDNWSIEARLCRVWEAVDFKNDNDVFALEMVFVDAEGDSIQGYVRKNHITRFKPMLKEGEVYLVRNFKVSKASVHYRVVANNSRIYFNVTTTVRSAPSVTKQIPLHAFSFVSETVLDERVGNNTLLTDIIGCIVASGPIEHVVTGPKREIELKSNQQALMKVTLWGKASSIFDLTPYDVTAKPVIAIVTSTTVRKFKGEFSFNSTTATRIYLNAALPDVEALWEMYAATYDGIKDLQRPPGGSVPLTEQASVNRVTIKQLLAMEWVPTIQEQVCTFVGEIVEINERYGWCYISCNHCNKKVVPKSGSFECGPCKKTCSYPVIRYKIHVRVKDSTATTTLVIFNDDAERFVKVPASTFTERIGTGASNLPHEISTVLLGKSFVFKLKVTDYNLKDGLENYTVTRLFEVGLAEQKRKLENENSTTHGEASTLMDNPTSSGSNTMPPITPKKEPYELKKSKRAG